MIERCLLLMFLLSMVPLSQAASFDCTKAVTNIDKTVCSNYELSQLDEKQSELFYSIKSMLNKQEFDSLLHEQRYWLKERNKYCDLNGVSEGCLIGSYKRRINTLEHHIYELERYKSKDAPKTIQYAGKYGEFKIYPLDDKTILFYFYKKYGHSSGVLLGEVPIEDGVGFFELEKWGGCHWKMTFKEKSLKIDTIDNKTSCGFGNNIYAHGNHIRYSKANPVFFRDQQEGLPVYFRDIAEQRAIDSK